MKVLFATTNQAKIKKYKSELEKNGIELITINDLDFKLDIDERRKTIKTKLLILYWQVYKEYIMKKRE